MKFLKNIFERQEKNNTVLKSRSIYFYDIQPLKKKSVKLETAEGIKTYELGFRCGSNKPLHDYDYLVFRPTSYIYSRDEIKEFNTAVKSGAKIIIICGNIWHPSTSTLPLYYFFEHLKILFKFDFDRCTNVGREIGHINNPSIKKWWDFIKAYSFYFENLPEGHRVLAKDKAHHPIAWEFNNFVFLPSYLGCSWDCLSRKTDNERLEFIKQLLIFIHEFDKGKHDPEWVDEYLILNEKELILNKENLVQRMKRICEIKKIFTSEGTELQNIILSMLDDLDIKWAKPKGTEDCLIEGNPNIVIEIAGTKNNLNSKKAIQSLQHKQVLKEKIEGNFKSCVIINYLKEKRPDMRDKLDHHAITEYYKKENICVMSTLTFLSYYENITSGKIKKEDFLKKIADTNGELQ